MLLHKTGILVGFTLLWAGKSVAIELDRQSYCHQGASEIRQVSTVKQVNLLTHHVDGHPQHITQIQAPRLSEQILSQNFNQFHLQDCLDIVSDEPLYNRDNKQVATIHFKFDQAKLSPLATQSLQGVAQKIATQPTLKMKIDGHTDNSGSDAYNQKLSILRASNSASVLIYQGVHSNNVQLEGFGENQPHTDNSTKYGRSLNRRSLIYVVE
ncbi:OmpA family protein [Vibrio hippocampi]|uniref:Peptidoglycan-associated lipoprotein n=1 Tax=Vibrio hippocampi TaxID=654686 RepID=A0ABM8ZMM0_9VIBR|nr:OmpA family protein [Vibrio hippocampi]CAH0529681.1 Peptidoglycan-associated lipoprotein [Vibrio hippocampi]